MRTTTPTATTVQISLKPQHRALLRAIAALMDISTSDLVSTLVVDAGARLGLSNIDATAAFAAQLGGDHE